MEEVFNNILYFIPIAFIIALRVLNSKNKKGNQKKSSGDTFSGGLKEIIRKIQEAEAADEKTLADSRPVQTVKKIHPPARPAAPKKVKKQQPVKIQSAAKPKQTIPEQYTPAQNLQGTVKVEPRKIPEQRQAAAALQNSISKLPPLQQAVIWSEILGQPKGVSV